MLWELILAQLEQLQSVVAMAWAFRWLPAL